MKKNFSYKIGKLTHCDISWLPLWPFFLLVSLPYSTSTVLVLLFFGRTSYLFICLEHSWPWKSSLLDKSETFSYGSYLKVTFLGWLGFVCQKVKVLYLESRLSLIHQRLKGQLNTRPRLENRPIWRRVIVLLESSHIQ